MRHGLIALLDKSGTPEIVVGSGWSENTAKIYFERLPERAIGQIVTTKMPLVIENVRTSRLFAGSDISGWGPKDGQPYSLIGVPIKDGDEVVGTLTVDRVNSGHSHVRFDHDVRFLTMVANLVGQTLRLHKLVAHDRERLMQENARLEKNSRLRQPETEIQRHRGNRRRQPRGALCRQENQDRREEPVDRAAARRIGHRQGIIRRGDP